MPPAAARPADPSARHLMKPIAPACERNREPILKVLRPVLRRLGATRVLEIGSGTGQHAVHFAAAMPELTWITSDRAETHPGIRAWLAEAALANVEGPLELDVLDFPALASPVDAVFSANTVHIMPWPAVEAMFAGVGDVLRRGGLFLLYGPFCFDGEHNSAGNAAFDAQLRAAGTGMGIRDLADLEALARAAGMQRTALHPMPANNFIVEWMHG